MTLHIGLDIGGTKIACAAFSPSGEKLYEKISPTPMGYDAFLAACVDIVIDVERHVADTCTVGVCFPGAINHALGTAVVANLPFLNDKPFCLDFGLVLDRAVRIANDANCIALAEALDGAGKGFQSVLGLTISTGVGAGFITNGQIVDGPNGLTGEIGHLPLPYREEADGPVVDCLCGQRGCIEKSICGSALSRLYSKMTGRESLAPELISQMAQSGNIEALQVMDRYYEVVAKAMVTILHSFDPDIIVVSGGLSQLPALFDEVPKRWGHYCVVKNVKTRFVPAFHGPIAGLRGAAFLWHAES